ncbi:polyprenyl synthetase family protein [Lignipirellula cremea]|uniref:Octaprenyl-diphosphate synthase n=1 Tax=Lignipirellula cremea TaxID=2528010 RepID=A0A518DX89_9BACT|nr:polyprenyl synthetase family protein [Lignipirellula cremea]QDU96440.1 Octaprenyl-diphosphate synthase [Lignipirellula cremea]
MSQTLNRNGAGKNGPLSDTLRLLYAPVADEMAEVENILQTELRSDYPFVDELVRYGNLLGGKRLRPALLLLSAKAAGKVTREHCVLAAVVEMIHTATLVHDDVLDEADTRRHLATVNSRWTNEASVLLGDYLFTHAFYLASTLDTTFACRVIGRSTNIVCEGELRQTAARGNYHLSEAEYLEIIEAKTAELCACCCQLGAHYAGADAAVVDKLYGYGRDLGIAFQIADDLLDVLGDESETGKSLGTDLEKEKPTLPLIHLLENVTAEERAELVELLSGPGDARPQLGPWFERHQSIDYARSRAQHYADQALSAIRSLPSSPSADVLTLIAEFVVNRAH